MHGIKVAERYYNFYGQQMIADKFPDYVNRIAVGLVGEGSECFGYDDALSRDHDWGPAFCLWLNEQDYSDIGEELQNEYLKLPKSFAGIPPRYETIQAFGRTGVISINNFYKKFTGLDEEPFTWQEWINIPEEMLACATNGKIFNDPFGEFTYRRNKLLDYYPEYVRLKKISERCITIGREGQYNLERSVRRREYLSAQLAEARFIEAAMSLAFLLNYRYAPFYKWMHRALASLPLLGTKLHILLFKMSIADANYNIDKMYEEKIEIVNTICSLLSGELLRQQLSNTKSNFLLDHVDQILESIPDLEIRYYKSIGKI